MDKEVFEIERKFLIKNLPNNLEKYEKKEILQGYISTAPALRLRKSNNQYFFTFKGKGVIKKVEFEQEITKNEFENLWEKIENNPIIKTRYLIPLEDELVAELDVYEGHLKGFANVEVEFNSIEQAKAFIAPSWFGKDISSEKKYSNASLSKISLEEIL